MSEVKVISGQFFGPTALKDRSVKFVIHTGELDPATCAFLYSLNTQLAYVAVKKEDFSVNEMDLLGRMKYDKSRFGRVGKSASQRLRNMLFVLYQKDSGGFSDFDSFYASRMEGIMDLIQKRISDIDMQYIEQPG